MEVYLCKSGHNELKSTVMSVENSRRTYLQVTAIGGVGCVWKKTELLAGSDSIKAWRDVLISPGSYL